MSDCTCLNADLSPVLNAAPCPRHQNGITHDDRACPFCGTEGRTFDAGGSPVDYRCGQGAQMAQMRIELARTMGNDQPQPQGACAVIRELREELEAR